MSKKGTTKDEMFLIKLYQVALQAGDVQMEFDRFEIGRLIGQNDKGANVIARDLAQANFVRKGDGEAVYLTNHGLRLVMTLLDDSW